MKLRVIVQPKGYCTAAIHRISCHPPYMGVRVEAGPKPRSPAEGLFLGLSARVKCQIIYFTASSHSSQHNRLLYRVDASHSVYSVFSQVESVPPGPCPGKSREGQGYGGSSWFLKHDHAKRHQRTSSLLARSLAHSLKLGLGLGLYLAHARCLHATPMSRSPLRLPAPHHTSTSASTKHQPRHPDLSIHQPSFSSSSPPSLPPSLPPFLPIAHRPHGDSLPLFSPIFHISRRCINARLYIHHDYRQKRKRLLPFLDSSQESLIQAPIVSAGLLCASRTTEPLSAHRPSFKTKDLLSSCATAALLLCSARLPSTWPAAESFASRLF
jgi:hypothetical protein